MKIIIVTETLLAGGAEWFALRLADAMYQAGHDVNLLVIRPDLVDQRLTTQFESLKIVHAAKHKVKLAVWGDRVLHKLTGRSFFLNRVCCKYIENSIRRFAPDVLHSHLLNTDYIVAKANKHTHVRHIVTVHGDYIQYIKQNKKKKIVALNSIINDLDKIAVISDEQLNILERAFPLLKDKFQKVYNGYPIPGIRQAKDRKETFNFGLIARGIPEKGWEPAIKAFQRINDPSVRLILYGEGEHIDYLKAKNSDKRVVFAGFTNNPLEAVAHLDVGLLPSYYDAESLPTTVIEYLALNKPVIATNVGEVNKMIMTAAGDHAGIIIFEKQPEKMVDPLTMAMQRFLNDTDFYNLIASRCTSAFEKFAMPRCIDSYVALYQNKTEDSCVVL